MATNWLSLGTKQVTNQWVLFDQPVVTVEVFRLTSTWSSDPPYRAKAIIAQFFNNDSDPLVSYFLPALKDEKVVVELKIPDYLKQLNNYVRFLGIKIGSYGYGDVYYSDWNVTIEEYNGN